MVRDVWCLLKIYYTSNNALTVTDTWSFIKSQRKLQPLLPNKLLKLISRYWMWRGQSHSPRIYHASSKNVGIRSRFQHQQGWTRMKGRTNLITSTTKWSTGKLDRKQTPNKQTHQQPTTNQPTNQPNKQTNKQTNKNY